MQADACLIANLIRLTQEGFLPNRDIIVALTENEESGDVNGIEWLLEHRRDLIDAIASGGEVITPGLSVRPTVEIVLAMYHSAKDGKRVTLSMTDGDSVWS